MNANRKSFQSDEDGKWYFFDNDGKPSEPSNSFEESESVRAAYLKWIVGGPTIDPNSAHEEADDE